MTGMTTPKLRFPGFQVPWKPTAVLTLLERQSIPVDVDPAQTYRQIGVRSHGKGIFHKEAVTGTELGEKRVFQVVPDALVVNIVFAWEQAVALTSEAEAGFIASHRFPMFTEKGGKSYLPFLRQMFLTKRGKILLEMASPGGAGRNKTLGQQEFLKLKPVVPSRAEQKKIADAIGAVDAKLAALAAKQAALVRFKAGLMQKLFSQQLRFTREDGTAFPDWEEKRLGEVFQEIKNRVGDSKLPTFSISAGRGFVSQEERFGKDISGQQNERYTALEAGDFSYNKGNSISYKFGCIYENNTGMTIAVPNVFISFRLRNKKMSGAFFGKLFEDHHLDKGLRTLISSGARMNGLLNVNKESFFKLKIPVPNPDEQVKIASALSAMDAKIQAVADQVTKLQTFKKGLLQQMFA